MRVLIADKFEDEGVRLLEQAGCEITSDPSLGPDTLASALAGVEALVVRSTKVPRAVVEGADALRLIVRAGAGYDNIDCKAAGERGVAVCNCPGMNAAAVAELAMGLILACDRRVAEQTAVLKAGEWNKGGFAQARGLKGRTLLVIGTGAIGREVVRRARAFDMKLVIQSRSLTRDWARELGVTLTGPTREDLLDAVAKADAVSVHLPLNEDTKGLCDATFFGRMKEGAIFVNTSRGGVVNEADLLDAMNEKDIRAGLDVYNDQPAEKKADWRPEVATHPNAVTTHHVGASTDQAQLAVAEETARIVRVFKETGQAEHCVNEEYLGEIAHA